MVPPTWILRLQPRETSALLHWPLSRQSHFQEDSLFWTWMLLRGQVAIYRDVNGQLSTRKAWAKGYGVS